MKIKIFTCIALLAMTGCAKTLSPAPQEFTTNDHRVIVGYEKPGDAWNCTYKGASSFNAGGKNILSVVSTGPSYSDAIQMGTDEFASKAKKYEANYVYRTMHTQSGLSVYTTSDDDIGKYYDCKNLPNLAK